MSPLPATAHFGDATAKCFEGTTCSTGLPTVTADQGALTTVMTLVFGIIGAVAVIIIIIAALSMISAQGDPQKVAKARQTIIYAAIGLAIAVSAEAIVIFVISKL